MNIQKAFNQHGLVAEISECPEDHEIWSRLSSSIDESSFDLQEWHGAWSLLSKWLCDQKMTCSLIDQLEYLACAAEGLGALRTNAKGLFAAEVQEYLKTKGLEKAVPLKR